MSHRLLAPYTAQHFLSPFGGRTAGTASKHGNPEALDPALDFFSHLFDAAKALATPGLKPPRPNARPLDNVAMCRALLPPQLEDSAAYRQMLRPVVSPEVKLEMLPLGMCVDTMGLTNMVYESQSPAAPNLGRSWPVGKQMSPRFASIRDICT